MMLFAPPPLGPLAFASLFATALLAAICDWRSFRIPNALVASSAVAALMVAAFEPRGLGLASAVAGGLAGLGLLLPLYLLRGMAAGDVKLMAVVGLYVGAATVTGITLLSFVIGGMWSLLVLASRSTTGRLWLLGIQSVFRIKWIPNDDVTAPDTRLRTRLGVIPFGVAIAIATLAMLAGLFDTTGAMG